MLIGEMIKQLRIEKGLKQKELAEVVDISRESIGNYERGTRAPSAEIASRIANALDVPVGVLIGEDADVIFSKLIELNDGLENGFSLNYDPIDKHEQTLLRSVIDYMKQSKQREMEKYYQGLEQGRKDNTDKP
ncbi:DNA-binding transcriptional regulator, XRE-family HTH domain [Carnobacterium alterfunditum]|uniref:DNA-binding transcriptional regulator, XRE-family HTH domain n=1 Tax=Carnobacterium alterfunditum TaxID=28230 RepID=A0A1N6FS33_9LACT|nr:helix-turn-helix domain-containing protein [Carnobacterium alterfunditum]SIN98032.1 DNA-binding transcriptional regulator, XRE-family HTH domain [Carnobacterium alterfunditum]